VPTSAIRASLVATGAALCLSASPASARPTAAHGAFTEAGIGAAGFIGADAEYAAIGPTLDLRAGYDLFSWLSVGVHLGAETHEATVPPPPEGEYFQLYAAQADGRLGFRAGRLGFFADGGLGFAYISSNLLSKVAILDTGETFSPVVSAGGGLEYQLENRHYAFGLAGQWWLMPAFSELQGFTSRIYLRYTY
jgi:hypothetical protein